MGGLTVCDSDRVPGPLEARIRYSLYPAALDVNVHDGARQAEIDAVRGSLRNLAVDRVALRRLW